MDGERLVKDVVKGFVTTANTFAVGAVAGVGLTSLTGVLVPVAIIGTAAAFIFRRWLFE